jgi:hypothetical protein
MAKLDPNTIIGILQGKLGNLVFSRLKNGQIVVRRRPVRSAECTAGERVTQDQFKGALAYVSRIRPEPALYAPYQAAAKAAGQRACDLANADFRHPPAVHDVDLSCYTGRAGESILIGALDDFEVVRVRVTITALDGTVREEDLAAFDPSCSRWRYVALEHIPPGQTVLVHVAALDRAGNVGSKSVHHAIVVGLQNAH